MLTRVTPPVINAQMSASIFDFIPVINTGYYILSSQTKSWKVKLLFDKLGTFSSLITTA
jgi:hypothetical protein